MSAYSSVIALVARASAMIPELDISYHAYAIGFSVEWM